MTAGGGRPLWGRRREATLRGRSPHRDRDSVCYFHGMPSGFLEVALLTDVGNVRQYNEDSVAVDLARGILALADGMGGHQRPQ